MTPPFSMLLSLVELRFNLEPLAQSFNPLLVMNRNRKILYEAANEKIHLLCEIRLE